jgi:hypothetical protein
MTMANHLPGSSPGIGEAEMIHNVVEARLQDLEHLFTGHTTATHSLLVNATKLALQ